MIAVTLLGPTNQSPRVKKSHNSAGPRFFFDFRPMTFGISTKDLHRARRNAERKRASVACARCKAGKTKCSDYRPCKKCKHSNLAEDCKDGDLLTEQSGDASTSRASFDARVHEWCMENRSFVMQARFPPSPVNTAKNVHAPHGRAHSVHDATTNVSPITSLAPGYFSSRHCFPGPSHLQYTRDTHHGVAFPPISSQSSPLLLTAPQTFLPPVAALILGSATAAATPSMSAHSIDNSLLLALRGRLQAAVAAPHPNRPAPIAAPPPFLFR